MQGALIDSNESTLLLSITLHTGSVHTVPYQYALLHRHQSRHKTTFHCCVKEENQPIIKGRKNERCLKERKMLKRKMSTKLQSNNRSVVKSLKATQITSSWEFCNQLYLQISHALTQRRFTFNCTTSKAVSGTTHAATERLCL